ncbi:uncharacterized protein MYCFIDRAFT_27751 [Pseudocercospora fijiensis CIRAD86]|uniref:RED-like N-terminal domain-containing protein n=1 Tax=Pseudocercospora fijiensis (strain CIRAD86) TaxID=383855 RepID=M3A8N3_PSEFD|nr:uncharacterized protein MYCFIDRAFT_27751 [Pseudocercospora fijiensis CIRAD86]EME80986.1 hypothetical protein MYCFIDRAFT_27751 [Pseudocercospora fijiensis CIRAD86]
MRNDDFRSLLSSNANGASPSSRPSALGEKKSAFVGMTPRPGKAIGSKDFARQVREQHASLQPTKKFKSVAPKGSKFAAGYTDRAKARQEAEDAEDDKAKRIKALEEQVKLGQLEQATFEALRDEITGGDVSSTHLVKGLDKKLLERVRRGEDVLGLGGGKKEDDGYASPDVDDELDQLAEKEVETVQREQVEKKGVKAPAQVAGKKRTRDEIMAELKAQRKAAADAKAASVPSLDSRWRRVGDQVKPKVEIDQKGREVVTITNEDGTVKKMVRKAQAGTESKAAMPDVSRPVLGADVVVPEQKKNPEPDVESDEDIFGGVGTEYDPLGGMDDEDNSGSDDETESTKPKVATSQEKSIERTERPQEDDANQKATASEPSKAQRNYFGESKSKDEEQEQDRFKGIENVLKKASQLGAERSAADEDVEEDNGSESKEERQARLAKRAKMLARQDRDMDDIDMGFGESRFEDEADFEDAKVKLSQWKGKVGEDDGWDEDEKSGKKEKKRKPKKRKGDANNMDDIMRVIEGRKQ